MPYIKKERRAIIAADVSWSVFPENIQTPGELNYAITLLCKSYIQKHPDYQGRNDVLGALEGAKLELYRRDIGVYEDSKIQENGDIA